VLVVLGTIVVLRSNTDRSRVNAGMTCSDNRLSVPDEGASAEFLCDGTPVFVIRHLDGTVSVLGALSRRAWGIGHLWEWCDSARELDDIHGSKVDEYGLKRGGPAPAGAVIYTFTQDGHDHVEVTGDLGRPGLDQPSHVQTPGPHCGGRTRPVGTIWHDASVYPVATANSPRTGTLYLFRGDLVVDPKGARMCMPDAATCTSSLPVLDIDLGILRESLTSDTLNGPYVGRLGTYGITEIFDVRPPKD
jgi:hypothetical protein